MQGQAMRSASYLQTILGIRFIKDTVFITILVQRRLQTRFESACIVLLHYNASHGSARSKGYLQKRKTRNKTQRNSLNIAEEKHKRQAKR